MSPAELIATMRADGFDLEAVGDRLRVLGEGDVPAALLAALRQHKTAILPLLVPWWRRELATWPEDRHAAWAHQAADLVMRYRMLVETAERVAYQQLRPAVRAAHPDLPVPEMVSSNNPRMRYPTAPWETPARDHGVTGQKQVA